VGQPVRHHPQPAFQTPLTHPAHATFTTREQIIEIVNRLFVYTDYREWQKLQTEVFTPTVRFDMSSLGAGAPKDQTAQEICATWESGFAGIDAVHHHSGNFMVTGERGGRHRILLRHCLALQSRGHAGPDP
jgi:hypothetical protein